MVVLARPAAADTDLELYVSPSSTNTTTPCTAPSDPCTLASAITEANGDSGDTIYLFDGTYDAPSLGFPAITSSQTWQGQTQGGAILSGDGGTSAPIVTVTSGTVEFLGLAITGADNDTSGNGGAIANASTLTVTSSVIDDNGTGGTSTAGAGIYNTGTLTASEDEFSGNVAGAPGAADGGAIYNTGSVTATDDTFSNNESSGGAGSCGGAICNVGTAILTDDTFSDNTAASGIISFGGAVQSTKSLTATDDSFTGNLAMDGGGINNAGPGTATISDDTFSDNTATYGGAINNLGGSASVADDTFLDNSATDGGAVNTGYYEPATLSLVASTFLGNTATDGDAVDNGDDSGGGTITVADNVVADPAPACDQKSGTWSDDGDNVASDSSCFSSTPASGDDNAGRGLAALLGPLADNGGPTATMELLAGNPALSVIPNNSSATIALADGTTYTPCPVAADQRGISSPPSAACDFGAVQSSFVTTVNGNASSATITYGAGATLAETEGLPPGATGTVTFSSTNPSVTLCSFTYPTDTSCTSTPNAGTYAGIDATFTDTDGTYSNAAAANALSLTVEQVTASTSTELSPASSSLQYGQEHLETFTTTVTGQSGDGVPEGTVTVYAGSTPVCSSSLGAGSGDVATAQCALGNDELHAATYSDVSAAFSPGSPSSSDGNYTYTGSASSPPNRLTVKPAPTGTTLTLTSPVTYGAEGAADFRVTVRAVGAIPVGSVEIVDKTKILCSTTLSPGGTGTCTLTSKELVVGTYSVTAIYTPSDENFLRSSSAPHKLVVRK